MASETARELRRRTVLKTAGSSVIFAGLAGCSGSNGGDGGDGSSGDGGTTNSGEYPDLSGSEVHLLTDETSESIQTVLKSFVNDFESTTGARVNFETTGLGGTAQNRLSQLIQADDPPEAFFGLEHSTTATFVAQDLIAPVNDNMQTLTNQYGKPSEGARIHIEGNDYFLPVAVNAPSIWFREDVLGPIPDTLTWESFAQLIAENDGAGGMPSLFRLRGKDTCTALINAMYASSNGAYLAERVDGEIRSALTADGNKQKWIDMLEFGKRIGQYSPRNAGAGCSQAIQSLSIEAASTCGYAGARPKTAAIEAGRDFAGDIVGRPWPRPDGEEDNATYTALKCMAKFDTENSKEADAFLDFFIKEGYYLQSVLQYAPTAMPAIPEIYESEQYQSGIQKLTSGTPWTQADIDGLAQAAQNSRGLASDTNPPNEKIGVFFGSLDIAEMIYEVEINGMDPAAALEKYDQQMQKAYNQAA